MGRKKNKQRRGDWSDEEESTATNQQQSTQQTSSEDAGGNAGGGGKGKQSRKEKRLAKQQMKQKQQQKSESEEEDDINALLLGGLANKYDDSEEEEIVVAQPVSKKKQKAKQKKKAAAAFAAFDSSSEEEEEVEEVVEDIEEEEDDDQIVEEVESPMQNLVIDDDDGSSDEGKKKKKKKNKEKKSSKKSKKESKKSNSDDEGDDKSMTEEEAKAARKAARKAEKAAKEERKRLKALAKLGANQGEDEKKEKDEDADANDDEVVYGAPDDHAWTDKSAAILESEKSKGNDGQDLSLIFGPDGKKLSNKERKKLLKKREAEQRMKEFEEAAAKASVAGAQFACSQTAVNDKDPQWMNTVDINIPSFNISAAGKILFKDASLNIAHGRRYGLIAPNGRGKSTLLKMIASKDLKLPPRVDYLYVEQEVVADNTPAVDAVLKADKRRWELLEEEKKLTAKIDAGDDDPKKIARLQNVYDELEAIGAEAAESKARRILFGLGFDQEMQTKPTKMFSGGWRMRISLARALFIEPTLLMLDEVRFTQISCITFKTLNGSANAVHSLISLPTIWI